MAGNQPYQAGRHFLQIPGPTNVPDRILRAMDSPTIDHRGPAFESLALRVLDGVRGIFQTKDPLVIYPASGTGAWEAALVNTLSTGDRVLMAETGQFATLWRALADRLGLDVVFLPGDWRHGVKADEIAAAAGLDQVPDFVRHECSPLYHRTYWRTETSPFQERREWGKVGACLVFSLTPEKKERAAGMACPRSDSLSGNGYGCGRAAPVQLVGDSLPIVIGERNSA